MLIALDEIDAMGAKELNVMKSVITASDVSERAAYGYTKERRIRLASFCASMLAIGHKIAMPQKGDIVADKQYLFEVGGKSKGFG